MFNNDLMKACLAAVFAIGLAACSSSDNGSAGTTDPMPTQEEQQLAALQQEIADLRQQLGIADDADIGDSITALMAERDRLQKQIDDAADDEAKAEAAATGKALFAALGPPDAADTTALDNAAVTDTDLSDGLAIDAAAGAGALATGTDPASVTLMAGDSAGSLGGWMGTNYAHMDAETKVENAAVVYNNQGPGQSQSFADAGIVVFTGATAGDDIKGYVTLEETDVTTLGRIMGATFLHSGTQNHAIPARSDAFYVRGTYAGAPGEFRCTGDLLHNQRR